MAVPTASQPIRTTASASFPGMYVGQSAISNANLREASKLALAQAPHAGSSLFSGPAFPLLDFNKGKKKLPSPQGTFPLNVKLIRRRWHFTTFLDQDYGSQTQIAVNEIGKLVLLLIIFLSALEFPIRTSYSL